jgi:prepilin-type N-terminal cleavage/methylation domain-containing protein
MCPARHRSAFTLVEVLIVVVVMAILAATVIPQFADSTKDARTSTAKFNLHMLRSLIELYKQQHDGNAPAALSNLTQRTNSMGTVGTGTTFLYGPYLSVVPANPFTGSNTVTAATSNPPLAASGSPSAGWLYHAPSGGVWIDDATLLVQ